MTTVLLLVGLQAEGNPYLRESFKELDYIKSAKIVD